MSPEIKRFLPEENNLHKDCIYWGENNPDVSKRPWCILKHGPTTLRKTCQGKVDEGCLFLRNRRIPENPTEEMIQEFENRLPQHADIYIALREKIQQKNADER